MTKLFDVDLIGQKLQENVIVFITKTRLDQLLTSFFVDWDIALSSHIYVTMSENVTLNVQMCQGRELLSLIKMFLYSQHISRIREQMDFSAPPSETK